MRFLALVFFCCLGFSSALAQQKTPEQIFEEAERLYNIRDYEAALSRYKELYLATGEPALLYNMAQCYRLLGKREDALNSYKTFLRLAPDAAVRSTVEQFIKDLEADLAANPTPSPQTPKPKESKAPLLLYGGAGLAGLAGVGTGIGFFVLRGQLKTLIDAPDSGINTAAIEEQLGRTKAMGTASNALVGAALVCAGAGWILSRNKPEPTALQLSLSPSGLWVSGGF